MVIGRHISRATELARPLRLALLAALVWIAFTSFARAELVDFEIRFVPSPSPNVSGYVFEATSSLGAVTGAIPDNYVIEADGTARATVGLPEEVDHVITLRAYDRNGDFSQWQFSNPSNALLVRATPVVRRFNAGDVHYTQGGLLWIRDGFVVTGGAPEGRNDSVLNSSNPGLYQTRRSSDTGNIRFAIPLEDGEYRLRLHFAEFPPTLVGERLFHVDVEGQRRLDSFDLFETAGWFLAHVEELDLNVSDGVLNVDLIPVVGSATLSAIEVVTLGPVLQATAACTTNPDCQALCGEVQCIDGVCVEGSPNCPAPGQCQQGYCDPVSGCAVQNLADGTSCSDGDASTGPDECQAGVCVGAGPSCTSDAQCGDGNACTGSERCVLGTCWPGTPLSCGSGGQCQTGYCDTLFGCQLDDLPDGTPCNDGDSGTTDDACSAGVCEGGGTVADCFSDGDCSNGDLCDGSEQCISGTCVSGAPPSCSVSDECRIGSCDAFAGCVVDNASDGTSCDDGDSATENDRCFSGVCAGDLIAGSSEAVLTATVGATTLGVPTQGSDFSIDAGGSWQDLRPAWCDLEGDGEPELLLGRGPGSGGTMEVLYIANGQITSSVEIQGLPSGSVATYRSTVGETRPACGDLDNDGRDEIVIGLGANSRGKLQILDDALAGFTPWARAPGGLITAPVQSDTRVAVGDFDGDGYGEIAVGYASFANRLDVLEDWRQGFSKTTVSVSVPGASPSELRPAAGDVDGDGRDELLVGVGTGGRGYVEVRGDKYQGFAHVSWLDTIGGSYDSADGRTVVALGDLDDDGKDEIVVGHGPAAGARVRAYDDSGTGYSPYEAGDFSSGWRDIGFSDPVQPTRPAIP